MQSSESQPSESPVISAAQVVYTNIEAEQSPRGNRGFQTVFFTTDKIDRHVLETEIEPALQYFPRSNFRPDNSPCEFLFFTLSTGQVAIGQITPLLDEVDKFNRKKMLFAHVLVFDGPEFRRKLNNNPFAIIDAAPFFSNYAEVARSEGVEPGTLAIPSVRITAAATAVSVPSESVPAGLCTSDMFKNILMIASAAAMPKREAIRLQLRGDPNAFLGFMRTVMGLIPPAFRTACSFDTAYLSDTGQSKAAGVRRWAVGVGAGQKLKDTTTIPVDLATGQSRLGDVRVKPATPFERWFVDDSQRSDFRFDLAKVNEIHGAGLLQELLWGQVDRLTCDVNNQLFQQFLSSNGDYVTGLLKKNFSKFPGAELADELTFRALQWISAEGPTSLSQVARQFGTNVICQWLIPRFESNPASRTEAKELAAVEALVNSLKLANKPRGTAERQLSVFFSRWKGDEQRLRRLLVTGSEFEFERDAKWLLRSLDRKISKREYVRKQFAVFFGFGVESNEPGNDGVLQALTGELSKEEESQKPEGCLGAGFRRRTVLQLMCELCGIGNSSKKNEVQARYASLEDSGVPDYQPVPSQSLSNSERREITPTAVLYGSCIIVSQQIKTLSEDLAAFLRTILISLHDGADPQFAFLRWGNSFVVALVDGESSIPSGWLWLLTADQLSAYDKNPFQFLRQQPTLAEYRQRLLSLNDTPSRKLADELPVIQRLLLLAGRKHKMTVIGTGRIVAQTIEQLFTLLPIEDRPSCTFATCSLPDSCSVEVWMQGISPGEVSNTPTFNPSTFLIDRFPEIKAETPYEICLNKAPSHPLWDNIWLHMKDVFNDFDVMSELMLPQRKTEVEQLLNQWKDTDESGSTNSRLSDIVKLFIDLNEEQIRKQIHEDLQRREFGDQLSEVVAYRAIGCIAQSLPDSLEFLRSVTKDAVIQLAIEMLTTSESSMPEPLLLDDLKKLNDTTVGDSSKNAILLRMLISAFYSNWEYLSFLVGSLERRDDGGELIDALAQTLIQLLPSAQWEFICGPEGEKNIGVGIQVNLQKTCSGQSSEAGKMICSLFGANNVQSMTAEQNELTLDGEVSGQFWPCLLGNLQSFSDRSKEQPHA